MNTFLCVYNFTDFPERQGLGRAGKYNVMHDCNSLCSGIGPCRALHVAGGAVEIRNATLDVI